MWKPYPKNGHSLIHPLSTKRSKKDPRNYRGIAVILTIGRIYSRVLKNLIEEEIREKQPEEQAGFKAGRSTVDNAVILKIALKRRVQRNRDLLSLHRSGKGLRQRTNIKSMEENEKLGDQSTPGFELHRTIIRITPQELK